MTLFGHKRKRPLRPTTLRHAPSPSKRLDERLRDRHLVLRLLLCAAALVALLVAVKGWKAPFPHRVGDYVRHGITARVDFERINLGKTQIARANNEARVPYVMIHNPEPLRALPAKLRAELSELAQAESIDALSPQTRAAFGLQATPPDASSVRDTPTGKQTPPEQLPPEQSPGEQLPGEQSPQPAADDMNQEFATLKAALTSRGGSPGHRIDDLMDDFRQFIAVLVEAGVAEPEELDRDGIRRSDPVLVVPTNSDGTVTADSKRAVELLAGDVLLSEAIKETGRLGKSWTLYPDLAAIRPMLEHWLLAEVPVTLHYDASATEKARSKAREQTQAVPDVYNAGTLLVQPGTNLDDKDRDLLQAEYDQIEQDTPLHLRVIRVAVVFGMILVLAVLNGYYLVHNERALVKSVSRLSIYLSALVLTVFLARVLSFDPWRAEIIPLTAAAMIFAIAYNQELATLTAGTLALVIVLSSTADLGQFVVLISVAATAVIPLADVPSRSKLIKVGFGAAVVYFLVTWGMNVIQRQTFSVLWTDTDCLWRSARGFIWCLVTGYLVAGSLPFIESAFGVVTDISLLELGDISHPLLQELVRRAPGTYNHSVSVATIGETAADRIGANGLLVRVGAYFHDIGKMLKPQYFIENMTEGSESRHEHLAPAMSTLIIIGHVKDGVDLARQHHLPPRIIDFIEQHHGTTLVAYFYRAAAKQADEQPDHKTDAEESSFRYPGPKPQTREAGVMMLADAVESASRTLNDPTPKRIESLVHEITLNRLLDGQFDECPLTLNEIHAVEESLIKSLIAIYHGRIKYPAQRTA